MKPTFFIIALSAAFPALAENTRQLDAHEHGVGALNIAIDGTTVAMAFEAPGADIVGFEYAASKPAEHAAIDAAIATLGAPLDVFVVPAAARCAVVSAQAELESDAGHEDHGEAHHDDHADEGHDDHADEGHDDHADEGHDDHADDGHDDHAGEGHDDAPGHTEFHAEYTLKCDTPDALTQITFAYFEAFPSAQEVEVQMVTASGAQAFEVARDAPVLNLER